MVKREKARRVWRLNKKEGIPVLDALETVDISKDVYYRIKDEYEEKWEEEILTVEQIQKRLSEATEALDTLENRTGQVQERLDEVRADAREIETAADAYHHLHGLEYRLEDVERDLDEIAGELGKDRRSNVTVGELDSRLSNLEELDIERRLHDLEQDTSTNRRIAESAESEARKLKEKMVTSLWDLI